MENRQLSFHGTPTWLGALVGSVSRAKSIFFAFMGHVGRFRHLFLLHFTSKVFLSERRGNCHVPKKDQEGWEKEFQVQDIFASEVILLFTYPHPPAASEFL